MINGKIVITSVLLAIIVFVSCNRKGCTDEKASNYSVKAKTDDGSCIYDHSEALANMLSDIGNYIILPRYEFMDSVSGALNTAVITFTGSISKTNLSVVKQKLVEAELAWQKCSTFEFGPAEDNSLRTHVNTFPTDTAAIEEKITSGTYDLSGFLAVGYKGLPAIDYLLNHDVEDSVILAFESSVNRVQFLKDLSSTLVSDINTVYEAWRSSGGNYIQTFTTSEGSDVSSSLSLLVNRFNYDYELLKNAKIGIPIGKATLGNPMPEQLEAYYGGVSSQLANESLKGLYDLYKGISESGVDKNGFHDYLIELDNEALSTEIDGQFQTIVSSLEAVPDPMDETIENNLSIIDAAYEEIKKLVVSIKTDMPAEMEVSITYSDGDGD